jgi:hypothetical protein
MTVPYVHIADLTKSYDALNTYLNFGFESAASVNAKAAFLDSISISNSAKIWLFVKQPMNIIDILAIAPFYIELIIASENKSALVALRILRVS